jgi:2'-5' RNA ligase
MDARIYVELLPTEDSRSHILSISDQVKASGRKVDPAKWHVTIIHFGAAQDVYNQIMSVVPSLSLYRFTRALDKFTAKVTTVLPQQIELQTAGFALFGPDSNVLTIRFDVSDQIFEAHKKALEYLVEFFHDCGLKDPYEFMRDNQNFQYALGINPHLTLMRGVAEVNMDSLHLPETRLGFLPASLAGI